MSHTSACAVHNEPAYPNGPCNCGAWAREEAHKAFSAETIMTWPRAGWCKSCKQPVGAWAIDTTKAETDYAAALIAAERRGYIAGLREAAEIAHGWHSINDCTFGMEYEEAVVQRARADGYKEMANSLDELANELEVIE